MKENRQMVRKRRKQDFTMDDLNDEEETEGVDEFKSTAKPTENRNRPPKRRSTRNIQYKVRRRNFTLYTLLSALDIIRVYLHFLVKVL